VSITISTVIGLLSAHCLGDFAWQNAWMAAEKGRNWDALFAHCATYTAVFVLFSGLPFGLNVEALAVAVIFLTHIGIDLLKARYHLIKAIWQDQLCHFVVLGVLVFAGLIS
jgi:hypothetical protein